MGRRGKPGRLRWLPATDRRASAEAEASTAAEAKMLVPKVSSKTRVMLSAALVVDHPTTLPSAAELSSSCE
jgi:hypothetical protein